MSIARKVKRAGGPKASQARPEMICMPGGEFTMGSDHHYAEEKPAHRVKVDGFWIDATSGDECRVPALRQRHRPRHLRRDRARPEGLSRRPAAYAARGLARLRQDEGPVDLTNWSNWWTFGFGADWRHPYGPGSSIKGLDDHPVVHIAYRDAEAYAKWAGKELPTRGRMGVRRARRAGGRGIRLGERARAGRQVHGQYLAGRVPVAEFAERRLRDDLAGRHLSAERLRPLRHDRQCLGMDHGLVFAKAQRRRCRRPAACRRTRAAGPRRRATIPASPRSRFRAR